MGIIMTSVIDNIALVFAIIGGLNWGSIGVFGVDFVGHITGGSGSVLARILYAIVGLAALWSITILFKEKVPESYEQRSR